MRSTKTRLYCQKRHLKILLRSGSKAALLEKNTKVFPFCYENFSEKAILKILIFYRHSKSHKIAVCHIKIDLLDSINSFEVERDSLLTKNKNISRYQATNLLKI